MANAKRCVQIIFLAFLMSVYYVFLINYDRVFDKYNGNHNASDTVAFDAVSLDKDLYQKYGYNITISDNMPFDRSLPDTRHKNCKKMNYSRKLPKSAIIITFYNERMSTLLRTLYSILHRTPDNLIQEIILVDDGSDWLDVQAPLDDFLQQNFPPKQRKVRLLRLQQRRGLMGARMEGARNASQESKVLIFLHAHLEMMHNWLPPLLEPIVRNPKACTAPHPDSISSSTLQYRSTTPFRTYLTRYFDTHLTNLYMHELQHPEKPFIDYILSGYALAIRADFFWQLGGFDEGMSYWGSEQIELSFKIWMCGGKVLGVPCSRVGHLFRDPYTKGNTNLYGSYSFYNKNKRRVIDVWLDDEHRQRVFVNNPYLASVAPGDISAQIAIRNRLKCKSFRWMMETIMPEVNWDTFGNGTIRSYTNIVNCIAHDSKKNKIVLQKCVHEDSSHFWFYTVRCEFQTLDYLCLDAGGRYKGKVNIGHCHNLGGNQKWFYDAKQNWILNYQNKCMVANSAANEVDLAPCDAKNPKMRWIFDLYNSKQIKKCR